ncbi:MAG: hypothetical protein HEQ16_03130 [Bosea sp.]|nr:hypothetical protein [Bosea sp. (in: a-proteobacteria)]
MPSKTSKSINRYVAFKLDGGGIDRIVSIFSQYERGYNIKFKLSDKSVVSTDDVNVLKKFPNINERRIQEVSFKADFALNKPSIEITFSYAEGAGARINYDLSGDDKDVLHISSEFETLISSLKLIYSPLVVRNNYAIGAEFVLKGLLFTLMVSLSLIIIFYKDNIPPSAPIHKALNLIWYIFVSSLFYMPILRFLFPPTCFAIGQGVNRYEAKTFWRITVLLALVIGVVGSLVAVKLEWLVK